MSHSGSEASSFIISVKLTDDERTIHHLLLDSEIEGTDCLPGLSHKPEHEARLETSEITTNGHFSPA